MPIELPEIPPATPGTPVEPPQESPPGSPRPEIPPPIHEPGESARPDELPGKMPEELPVRGPQGPRTPYPATDAGSPKIPQGTMYDFDLKQGPECAMNKPRNRTCARRNKYDFGDEARHNPAQRLFVDRSAYRSSSLDGV